MRRFHPKQPFPGTCRRKWLQPARLGDSFSPDRAARRQDRKLSPCWALRSAVKCCLHRNTQIKESLKLASPSPTDVQREPPTLSSTPTFSPPYSRPPSPPPPPTQTPRRAPLSAGLQGKGSVDIWAEELTRICKAACLSLGDSLPTPRRHPPPAAVLPRHSSLTLTQTPGSYRDWRGTAGTRSTRGWGWRRGILGLQEVGGASVFLF